MQYYKNKILNFEHKYVDDEQGLTQKEGKEKLLKVSNYKSLNILKIKQFIKDCPSEWFAYVKVLNNTNVEKLAYDIYGSADFWDLLVLINDRSPLFEMPYDFDVIERMTEKMVSDYEKYVYKKSLPEEARERLRNKLASKISDNYESLRVIKYIKPTYVYEFLNELNKNGLS